MDENNTESLAGTESQTNDNSPFGGLDPNQTLGSALKNEDESTEETSEETQTSETSETSEESTEETDETAGNEELVKAQKKAADAEAGLKKWKTISKDLIKQMKEAKETGESGGELDEDFKDLHALLKKELAPLQAKVMEQEQSEILNEIAEMPYTKELGPEIKAEFDKLGHIENYRARIETARAFAIANSAHLLAELGQEAGMAKAYKNQGEKKAQKGSGERSAAQTGGDEKSVLDKLKGGMSTADYREHAEDIDKELKAMLGI